MTDWSAMFDPDEKQLRQLIEGVDWDRFDELNRSLNWELWMGPMVDDYWTEVDPLEHYKWEGFVKAEEDIREIADTFPATMWCDEDGAIMTSDPYDDEYYWNEDGYIGPEFAEFEPARILLRDEVYKQVYR